MCIALRRRICRASRLLKPSIKGKATPGLLVVRLWGLGHARIGELAPRIKLSARPVVMKRFVRLIMDLSICNNSLPRPKPLDQSLLQHVLDLIHASII
jgi:hypothetical protein